jgi:hypothetical protein
MYVNIGENTNNRIGKHTTITNLHTYKSKCKICQEFDKAIEALTNGFSTVGKPKHSLHETT